MPGRQFGQGENFPGVLVNGTTTVNGYTIPIDLNITGRVTGDAAEYVASNSVEFGGEFESSVSDEFTSYIADGTYAGTGNQVTGGGEYGTAGRYRYGFNGKENDNEVKGVGNQQDYGMRIYDPRLGKFLSVDPITKQYPELTPYQFASNRPIDGIDRDGLEYTPSDPARQRDATAVKLYPFHPETIQRQKENAPKLNILRHAASRPLEFLEDKNHALFLNNLNNPDNIGGNAAFGIYSNIHDAKVEFKEGNIGMGILNLANAGINTMTLTGAGPTLGAKGGLDVKSELPNQSPTLQQKRTASIASESIVRSRLVGQLKPDEILMDKPRFYIKKGGVETYTVPDFAVYNTKLNQFVSIPDAKNFGGKPTTNQNILNNAGGEFRGSSRYPQVKPQSVVSGLVTVESTSVQY